MFDQQIFTKKNEAVLRCNPEKLREKLFKNNRTRTSKLSKTKIGDILTKRNNEIVNHESDDSDQTHNNIQAEEKELREKNAKVCKKSDLHL